MSAAWQTRWTKIATRSAEGQGLAEYALILAFIAVIAVAALAFLGGQINVLLSDIGNKI